jgi:hypothetical protein
MVKAHTIESIFEMDIIKDALEKNVSPTQLSNTKILPMTVFSSSSKGTRHPSSKNGTKRKSWQF